MVIPIRRKSRPNGNSANNQVMESSNFRCIKKRATAPALMEATTMAITIFSWPKSIYDTYTVIAVSIINTTQTIK
jgi:hypothetical protein